MVLRIGQIGCSLQRPTGEAGKLTISESPIMRLLVEAIVGKGVGDACMLRLDKLLVDGVVETLI